MKRQERRRQERAGEKQPPEPFIPQHDLEQARERYLDLVKQRGLSADDVHAIMMGGTSDALMTYIGQQWPNATNPLAILEADFETLRRRNEHDVDGFAGAILLGWLMLLSSASVSPGRLPP